MKELVHAMQSIGPLNKYNYGITLATLLFISLFTEWYTSYIKQTREKMKGDNTGEGSSGG